MRKQIVPTMTTPVTTGRWKGCRLVLPQDEAVRPSRNMVRQAMFNLLGSRVDWPGLTVADLCCGSGALGLEAASRGAAPVFCVDTSVKAVVTNVQALAAGDVVHIAQADARRWVPPALLDMVLADPPYASDVAQALLARRGQLGRCGTLWLLETGTDTLLDTAGFDLLAQRDYGRSRVWLLEQV